MAQDTQVQKASPVSSPFHLLRPCTQFLEVFCKSSGKIRRFGKGAEAQFALRLINQKLGAGVPLATYIEAVKDGEEPVSFGPGCILIDYGNGWKLQTSTSEGSVKENGVKSALDQFPTDADIASGKKDDVEPVSEQFSADEGFEKVNGVELTMEQFPTYEETSFEQDTGLETVLEQSPTHEAFEKENDVGHTMEQFSTDEAIEQENGVEPVLEQFPTDEDFAIENSREPALEQFPMDEGFEKENDVEPAVEKFSTDEELEKGNSMDVTLEKFADVTVSPLPNTAPLSMIHLNYSSDGEEDKNIIFDDSAGVCIDTADMFTTTEIFVGKDELVDYCKKIGMSIGVMVIIGRSDSSNSKRRPRVILNCERSGVYIRKRPMETNSNKRTREVGSKKCNCPFRLKGIPRDEFEGGWELKVECGTHNHPLKENLIGHPYIERLTPEEEAVVSDLSKAGVRPQEMLEILKKRNPNNLSTKYTIYNYRARNRLSKLHWRSNRKVEGDDA